VETAENNGRNAEVTHEPKVVVTRAPSPHTIRSREAPIGEKEEKTLFRKLLLAGVVSAVVSLGIAGFGTASADDGHHGHEHDHPCWVEATHTIDPACYQGLIWGGVARGWIPQNYAMFDNFWQAYYFFNYSPTFYYWYNVGYWNQNYYWNGYVQPYTYNVYGQPYYNLYGYPVNYQAYPNQLPMYWWLK
jgi:hypothetical protein